MKNQKKLDTSGMISKFSYLHIFDSKYLKRKQGEKSYFYDKKLEHFHTILTFFDTLKDLFFQIFQSDNSNSNFSHFHTFQNRVQSQICHKKPEREPLNNFQFLQLNESL